MKTPLRVMRATLVELEHYVAAHLGIQHGMNRKARKTVVHFVLTLLCPSFLFERSQYEGHQALA